MSLNVYLRIQLEASETVPVRIWDTSGVSRELTRIEWNTAFPDFNIDEDYPSHETVYSSNITHNLGGMAEAAGIGDAVWNPEDIEIVTASQMIEPLRQGIELLKSNPQRFKSFSASNGWGTYEQFIPWLTNYLNACEMYPNAEVSVCR